MRCFLIAIASCLLAGLVSSYSIPVEAPTGLGQDVPETKSNSDTLIFAHVIYRHGKRNIAKIYPNDPYKDEIHWPGGYGQLTKEGKMEQYELGRYFRRRYNSIIGETYSPNNVYVQSTDVDRTLMSAQANLAGLFVPTNDEIWHEEIPWQPIPVHTMPKKLDFVLSAEKDCPKYDAALEKYMNESPEVQRILTKNADLLSYWSKMCGKKMKTIRKVYSLHKTLSIERDHQKKLPEWAEKAIEPNGTMEYIAKYYFKLGADTKKLARLKSGFLLKEILEHFSEKIDSTLKPNYSLWLYSAHDSTLANMLNSLGLFELHIPPYASSLHFELFKTGEDERYIQIFYRKSGEEYPLPMNIPECGEKCPLKQFRKLYKKIIPDDFDSECSLD